MTHPSRLLLTTLVMAGCATAGGTPNRSTRDLIALDEIQTVEVTNAFELIQRLRPEMLRQRSGLGSTTSSSSTTAIVYVDGVRSGELDQLYTIPKQAVREVQYVSAADATTRWGTGHSGGVIMILTRRGRD